jgi:mRNA interferase YafQ
MTYDIVATNKFKSDLKRMDKRGKDLSKLDWVINELVENRPLPPKYKNHALKGEYSGMLECHIDPDWLLIYAYDHDALILYEIRTGTHSDLFNRNIRAKSWWSRVFSH